MNARTSIAALCLLLPLISCQRPWPPDTAARWDGGNVSLTDIELRLSESLDASLAGEDLVKLYLDAAQELCVRDYFLHERATETGVEFNHADRELTKRLIIINTWVNNQLEPEVDPTDEEIEAFYADHPEFSHRPERRFVEHIFRRITVPADEGAARDVLAEVTRQFLEGEPFQSLAIDFSQSETSASGGVLGLVSPGDLHEEAEKVVFSLEPGEISQPTQVHGGLAVFVVTRIFPEKTFPLSDVRPQVEQQLHQEKLRKRLDSLAEQATFPPGTIATSSEAFHDYLESDNPKTVLYSDDTIEVTVGQWRSRLMGETAEAQLNQYTDFLRLQLIYHHIAAEGFLESPGQREIVETRYETTLNDQLVTLTARKLLIENAKKDPSALMRWYEENRERYQSQIELLIHLVVAPHAGEVEEMADSLRSMASAYAGGSLEQRAESIPAAQVSQARIGIGTLDTYHPKVKASLLSLTPPACTPVFNIGNALHLFCLEHRKEPQQLSFEEARDRVIEDYVAANEQELYAGIKSEILDEANFEFNETRVRKLLHAPASQDPTTP